MKAALFVCAFAATAQAAESRGRWLRDHFIAEVIGAGGWRTAIAPTDRASGFDELAGGGEVTLGLDVWGPLGVIAQGRFLAGDDFYEGTGALGLQVRASERVRLRVGPSAGQLRLGRERAVLVGGFVSASVDLIPFGGGRVATAIALRFDADGSIGGENLPQASLALALGIGFRY